MRLYNFDNIGAECLSKVILDSLLWLNPPISRFQGLCYDGCSTMSGAKTGVAKRKAEQEPCALFTHCYGYSLNLAASDTIRQSKIMKNSLDTAHEITKFSPKREAIFKT